MKRIEYNTPADLVRQLLILNGAAFAGRNVYNGCGYRVNVSTLRMLERKGEVVLSIGPDGGMMAKAKPRDFGYDATALSSPRKV